MAKRTRIFNEDPSLNFRVSEELKSTVTDYAAKRNVTVSNYLRDLLEQVHSGEYCRREFHKQETERFLFSWEFVSLIVWMYSKRRNEKKVESTEVLESYVRTLKKIEIYLPENLTKEFDKVLADVLRVMVGGGYERETFKFVDKYEKERKFSFELLESYFLGERDKLGI